MKINKYLTINKFILKCMSIQYLQDQLCKYRQTFVYFVIKRKIVKDGPLEIYMLYIIQYSTYTIHISNKTNLILFFSTAIFLVNWSSFHVFGNCPQKYNCKEKFNWKKL